MLKTAKEDFPVLKRIFAGHLFGAQSRDRVVCARIIQIRYQEHRGSRFLSASHQYSHPEPAEIRVRGQNTKKNNFYSARERYVRLYLMAYKISDNRDAEI